jgi:hypothetical protein
MKITQNIDFGLRQMLLPFNKWLKDIEKYKIELIDVGEDTLETYFNFIAYSGCFTYTPDNEEIRHICKTYYNEECLSDLIYNQLLDPIVNNMREYGLDEITETL